MQIFDKKTIEYLMKLFKGEIFTPDGNLDVEHEGSDPSHVRVKNDVGQLDLLVDNIGDRGLYDTTEYETGWLIKTDGLDTYMNKGDVNVSNQLIVGNHISTSGNLTAYGDITATTGDISGHDINAGANMSAGGTLSAVGDISTSLGSISAHDDVTAGGDISATGNNSVISSGGTITAVGDISSTNGDITAYGDVTAGGDITATGDISGDDISATGTITAIGNISTSTGNVSADGDITAGGDITAAGAITATGNVTGAGFVVPNTTNASTKFLLADGGVDSYGRGWYMKRGSAATGSTNSALWFKVASTTIDKTGTHDAAATFFVGEYYLVNGSGILEVSCRKTSNATVIDTSKTKAVWICRDSNIVPANYRVSAKIVSSTKTILNVWCKLPSSFKVQRFSLLDEGAWYGKTNLWTLYDVTPPVDNQYCFSTFPSDETYFDSTDTSYAATAGAIATPSDERLKDVKGYVRLGVEDIAAAPSVLYTWKDLQDDKVHGGTIAQYWQKIAPWAVIENNDGMLSMNYPTLALAVGIQCARDVVDLRKEVADLRGKMMRIIEKKIEPDIFLDELKDFAN